MKTKTVNFIINLSTWKDRQQSCSAGGSAFRAGWTRLLRRGATLRHKTAHLQTQWSLCSLRATRQQRPATIGCCRNLRRTAAVVMTQRSRCLSKRGSSLSVHSSPGLHPSRSERKKNLHKRKLNTKQIWKKSYEAPRVWSCGVRKLNPTLNVSMLHLIFKRRTLI